MSLQHLRACAALAILLASSSACAQALLQTDWVQYPMFQQPAAAGALIVDFDGDGRDEVLLSGASALVAGLPQRSIFALLEQRGSGLEFSRFHRLLPGEAFASLGQYTWGRMYQLPLPVGQGPQFVVGLLDASGWSLAVFEGARLERVHQVPVDTGFLLYGVGDVDADGAPEAVGIRGEHPEIRDLASGLIEWRGDDVIAHFLSIGQLDDDAALEVMFGGEYFNQPGYVLDGQTRTPDWIYFGGFAGAPVVGEYDGDRSTREFHASTRGEFTTLFTSFPAYVPYDQAYTGYPSAQRSFDFNGDGVDEILFAGSGWDYIRAIETAGWTELFRHSNHEFGAHAVEAGRLDADAAPEVVVAHGAHPSGPDLLQVFDAASGQIEFSRYDESGPFSSALLADLDRDGRDELVFAGQRGRGIASGHRVWVVSPTTGAVLREQDDPDYREFKLGPQLAVANMDSDPQLEILIGSVRFSYGALRILDGLTLQEQADVEFFGERAAVAALAVLPAEPGSVPRVVTATAGRLELRDGTTMALIAQSAAFTSNGTYDRIHLVDLDGDDAVEILYGTRFGLHALDPVSLATRWTLSTPNVVIGESFEGQGDACRIVQYEQARLVRRDCATREIESERAYAIADVTFARPVADSYGNLILSQGEHLAVQRDDSIVAQSEVLGPLLGWNNRGVVARVGGSTRVLVGSALTFQSLDVGLERVFGSGFE